ncbi:hypothetical protein [Clostridium sp.]|uniref:hypothetical protein n=1 Tax=Clostridium sp. TaxID=1506 RepID=UPI0026DD1B0B|nr:hypothetical protein [Clostridium sp.]MDO5040347.1 hypothetical protein [Clostridium sp.]
MTEKIDIYVMYDYIIEEIQKGNDIKFQHISYINEREDLNEENVEYFIKKILYIENNINSFGNENRVIISKNCTRCIDWIKYGDRIYRELSSKSYKKREEKIEEEFGGGDDSSRDSVSLIDDAINNFSGIIYGNVSNASTIYGMDKFNTPRGHGFAAENANHLHDKINHFDFFGQGKVKLTGEEIDPNTGRIVKNGADRVVDGINIQTKYCSSGSKCISECFENGKLRYLNPDGTPMQIEVPSDKYDAAVEAMKNRIKRGEVPGVTDPEKAKDIVRKGNFTYEQAKNIAKFGTVESITFDAVNGAIIATGAMGISATLTFATVIWNGEDFDVAIKKAAYEGLKVGGTTFVTAVLSSQLSRAGLNSALVGSSEAIVTLMGPKASAMLVNAFRSGSNIYGAAAMKSAAKILRGNAITGAVSVLVLSSFDIANIFRGRISGSQLFKNIANTASTVAGGTAGWVGGAAAGAAIGSVIPIVGTAAGGIVGGILGSFAGGAAAGKASGAVLDNFIEDDANKMVNIIEKVFTKLAEDYLLNKKEAENIIDKLKDELTGSFLKDMFASSDREMFAKNRLEPMVEEEVKKRKKIKMPSDKEIANGLRKVLEDLSDEGCLI